jgi:carbon storage regulator
MLVLSRKENEAILIDEQILITVIKVHGDKVRLGVNAPADVAVHRYEVMQRIAEENQRVRERAAE